ncbi:MAG: ABC transporter substrate-binding protein [Christensenellales bacterium]|jgi:NitT/TauT family transport system substrate-binding protein
MSKKRLFISLALVLVLALSFSLAGCAKKDKALDKITLTEVTHSVFYAPQYAAIYLGYFEEEGIELELVNGGGADKSMAALLSGQADFGLMGPEAALYVTIAENKDPAVVIGQLTKRDGSFIVGREPLQGEFDWEGMRGKSIIGGRPGGMPLMTLEYVLKSKGLEPGSDIDVITNIQFDMMGGAFVGGTGDFTTLFEPAASQFEKEGKGYVLESVGSASGEVPYTAYMVRQSMIDSDPDLVQRFVNAIAKGQKWVQEHTPEEIAEVIKPAFPDSDDEILAAVAKRYKDVDAWMTTPVMTEDSFTRLQDIMEEAGELARRVDFGEVIDNQFAEKTVK